MIPRSAAFLLCISVALAVQARAQNPTDGCGDNKVGFKIKTEKNQPEPSPPAAGKAQIVFIETLNKCSGCGAPSIRFGMDGAWVGANKGNSYFAVDIEPGEHQFCAAMQSVPSESIHRLGPAHLTAEAGGVYYFEVKASFPQQKRNEAPQEMPVMAVGQQSDPRDSRTAPADMQSGVGDAIPDLNFAQLGDDEGKSRVKASAHSTFTSNK
jgi:hypothetical protein